MTSFRVKPDGRSVISYESTSIEIFMDSKSRTGRLSELFSISRGRGYATELMKMVCTWADENDIYLWCIARPYGRPQGALNKEQLVKFYEKFGFVQTRKDGKIEMHRKPQSEGFLW